MIAKILLPTDGSEYSENTIRYTIDLAKLVGASITVMYAYHSPTALRKRGAAMLEEFRQSLEEEAKETVAEIATRLEREGLTVAALAVEGPPAEAILRAAEAEKPDLIVMGSRGGGGLPGALLGSVAEQVVRHASTPVLVVK